MQQFSETDILLSLQKLIIKWVSTERTLTDNLAIGSSTVKVSSNYQFEIGEKIVVHSDYTVNGVSNRRAEFFTISDLPDFETITLNKATTIGHSTAASARIAKTTDQDFVKRVYIGDFSVIPDYPAITVSIDNSRPEWITLNSTSDESTFKIMVYVQDKNSEKAYLTTTRLAGIIREGLMQNIHPIIDSGSDVITTLLTSDVSEGDTIIDVVDASELVPGNYIVIRDLANADQHRVKRIVTPTEIELEQPIAYDFTLDRLAEVIRPSHYIWHSIVSDVEYGSIQKGSAFLKAGSITWTCKEEKIRVRFVEPKT